jgi:hypothetical protein
MKISIFFHTYLVWHLSAENEANSFKQTTLTPSTCQRFKAGASGVSATLKPPYSAGT